MGGYHLIAVEASRLAKLLPSSLIEAVAARLERCDGSDLGTLQRSCTGRPEPPPPSPCRRIPRSLAVGGRWRRAPCRRRRPAHGVRGREGPSRGAIRGTGLDRPRCRRRPAAANRAGDIAGHRLGDTTDHPGKLCHLSHPVRQRGSVRAAGRGVRINVVVETPDRLEGENEYNTIQSLGEEVAASSTLYYWPKEQRASEFERQAGDPPRQMRGCRRSLVIPVECQFDGLCVYNQHGAGVADHRGRFTQSNRTSFRPAHRPGNTYETTACGRSLIEPAFRPIHSP